jgi:chromosome segregation ATPase
MCASRSAARVAAVLATLCLAASLPAGAADKDAAKEQARRTQQMQRKFEQEKAQLTQAKAALEGELETARKEREAEAQRAGTLAREAAGLRGSRDALRTKLAETEGELAAMRKVLAEAEAEGKRLQAALAGEKQSLATCTARNEEMHRTGTELLAHYENKGCFDSVLQAERFTGLKRVEIENRVEDTRDRLDAQRVDPVRRVE